MIPDEFVGVWRRESIAIGDGPPAEPCDVIWLQARSGFADLRLPRDGGADAVAFAGRTTWEAPALTWHHHVSLEPPCADVGAVEWRGGRLVERGAMVVGGEPATYEEVWARLAPANLPLLVVTHDDDAGRCDATLVRVGAYALVMGHTRAGFAARHDRLVDGRWTTAGLLGSGGLPSVPCIEPAWRPGQLVELCGAPWRVREVEPAA